MGYYDRDYKREHSDRLTDKIKDYFGLDQGLKSFVQDNAWALSFGVLNGALSGNNSSNMDEITNAAILWAGIIPAIQVFQGFPYSEALKRSPKNIALYLAAYNLTQVILYQKI